MRHRVGQSVSSVMTSVGRFASCAVGRPADPVAPGGLEAACGGWPVVSWRCSSASRCSASRFCSVESSYFCESLQVDEFLYLSGTTSDICVRPLSSTQRHMDVECATGDSSASATPISTTGILVSNGVSIGWLPLICPEKLRNHVGYRIDNLHLTPWTAQQMSDNRHKCGGILPSTLGYQLHFIHQIIHQLATGIRQFTLVENSAIRVQV